jgi:pyruvate dehydrogenase E2 component (dihydrolipoamide acetyltransferase)
MPVDITMPKLGLTMTEGLIVEWRRKEGDPVRKGDILFVLETEKVTYEVEAPEDGTLGRIFVKEQQTVPVGAVVASLLKPGENAVEVTAAPAAAPGAEAASPAPAPAAAPAAPVFGAPPAGGPAKATPLAKKLARELGMDLSAVAGSGPGGRVLREDVEAARAAGIGKTVIASPAAEPIPSFHPDVTAETAGDTLRPLTGMRRTIARRMLQSKLEAAHAYMGNTIDASKLRESREALLPVVEKKHGVRLTVTDLMMKITGAALREHPVINTRWTEKGVLYLPEVHMGMAMALDDGLIVPVIRNINAKTLGQIAMERTAYIRKGRTNNFLPDDIKGSTFTLSAMGMFGLEQFTAIINQPENAILGVAAILDKPIAMNGQIVIRPMMNITLTYDHRTIDGAEAGKFMRTLKAFIEDPILILG